MFNVAEGAVSALFVATIADVQEGLLKAYSIDAEDRGQ